MTKNELIGLQSNLRYEASKRKQLGGYSADAACLELLTNSCLAIVTHLIGEKSKPKAKKKK